MSLTLSDSPLPLQCSIQLFNFIFVHNVPSILDSYQCGEPYDGKLSRTVLRAVVIYADPLSLLVLIELISYLARAVSLGVRLFANITAGHTLLKILSTYLFKLFSGSLLVAIITLIPFSIFLALTGLEIAVSLIQAFVFTLLVCSYLKDAIELH
jgi:ATP synthase subunit 6